MSQKIKKCPHCGGEAYIPRPQYSSYYKTYYCKVQCKVCGAQSKVCKMGDYEDIDDVIWSDTNAGEKAIAAWNLEFKGER